MPGHAQADPKDRIGAQIGMKLTAIIIVLRAYLISVYHYLVLYQPT